MTARRIGGGIGKDEEEEVEVREGDYEDLHACPARTAFIFRPIKKGKDFQHSSKCNLRLANPQLLICGYASEILICTLAVR